jgi:hypothetical protein
MSSRPQRDRGKAQGGFLYDPDPIKHRRTIFLICHNTHNFEFEHINNLLRHEAICKPCMDVVSIKNFVLLNFPYELTLTKRQSKSSRGGGEGGGDKGEIMHDNPAWSPWKSKCVRSGAGKGKFLSTWGMSAVAFSSRKLKPNAIALRCFLPIWTASTPGTAKLPTAGQAGQSCMHQPTGRNVQLSGWNSAVQASFLFDNSVALFFQETSRKIMLHHLRHRNCFCSYYVRT